MESNSINPAALQQHIGEMMDREREERALGERHVIRAEVIMLERLKLEKTLRDMRELGGT